MSGAAALAVAAGRDSLGGVQPRLVAQVELDAVGRRGLGEDGLTQVVVPGRLLRAAPFAEQLRRRKPGDAGLGPLRSLFHAVHNRRQALGGGRPRQALRER